MSTAGERVHPINALAEAFVNAVHQEVERSTKIAETRLMSDPELDGSTTENASQQGGSRGPR